MPLITRRSSTRALPRVSVGRCGLIFENCAFVSQNWSRLIYASFSEAVNHATTFVPTLLWVRTLAKIRDKCVFTVVAEMPKNGRNLGDAPHGHDRSEDPHFFWCQLIGFGN